MFEGVYMNKRKLIISVIALVIDQITKLLVQTYNARISIIDNFFSIRYFQNTGAAWSILEGKTTLLVAVSLIMLVFVYSMMFSFDEDKLSDTAFGLLFGGILGNLIDRIFYGFVRDFIAVRIFSYNYPIFNIADAAIVIGVILLIIATIKGDIKNGNSSKRRRSISKNR